MGGPEAAGTVERVEVRQVVDVEPFATCPLDLISESGHKLAPDTLAAMTRVNHRVQQECVETAVPASMDESDQVVGGEGAHPGHTVPLQSGCPRLHRDRRWICRVGECPGVQLGEDPIVDGESDSIFQLALHIAMVSGAAGFRRGAGVGAPVAGYDGSVSHREGAATGEIADLRCVCAFSAQLLLFEAVRSVPPWATMRGAATPPRTLRDGGPRTTGSRVEGPYVLRPRATDGRRLGGRSVRLAPAGHRRSAAGVIWARFAPSGHRRTSTTMRLP